MGVPKPWKYVLAPFLAGVGLGIGLACTSWVTAQAPRAPAAFQPEEPPYRGLDANLFMQTAAEFHACCYQAYNLATARLKEAAAKNPGGPRAVVLDLDETVFDNAGFQAMQLRSNLAYDQRLWDYWEEKHADQVGLIPGALDFIREAGKLGVTAIYISNRGDKYREQTKRALTRLDIPVHDDKHLLLSTVTSDKTQRRQEVEKEYTVLLYVGDNLRDFDERFRCRKFDPKAPEEVEQAIRERKAEVDQTRAAWGEKWIILPNPAYGEWTKPLGQGRKDLDRLAPALGAK